MRNSLYLLTTLLLLPFANCQLTDPQEAVKVKNIAPSNSTPAAATSVQLHPVVQKNFSQYSTTMGVLRPQQQTTIHLKATGTIQQLPIEAGQLVQKGTLIAAVEDQSLQFNLVQKQIELEEAIVNKKDLLIANGGVAEVDTSVSADKLDLILTLSGYRRAEQGIRQAEFQLQQAKIYAPFTGIIADVKVEQYQQGNAGQEICRLLNPYTFDAVFQVTESEALRLQKGQLVLVRPIAEQDKKYQARVRIINPVVSEQGLVTIKARLEKAERASLLAGMNVQIQLERKLANQLVVPKSALVLRSGKEVVFTYNEAEKVAKWNYVKIAYENDTELAIAEGLQKGDRVIIGGNLNLSHDAAVTVDSLNVVE